MFTCQRISELDGKALNWQTNPTAAAKHVNKRAAYVGSFLLLKSTDIDPLFLDEEGFHMSSGFGNWERSTFQLTKFRCIVAYIPLDMQ